MDALIFIWLIVTFLSGCLVTFLVTYRRKPALKLGETIDIVDAIARATTGDYLRQKAMLFELLDYMLTYGNESEVSPQLLSIITKVKDEIKQSKK